MGEQIVSLYLTCAFRENFWALEPEIRRSTIHECCDSLKDAAEVTHLYQVFPAHAGHDFFAWLTTTCDTLEAPAELFRRVATALTPFRRHVDVPYTLCGITKPSLYIRQRENPQEIDPYGSTRDRYFVVYPFAKTSDWYLKSREERQPMMNDHIKLGRSYPEIKQLLLYSFGIQDQEFVVAYEMNDLPMFSDLVQELRSTQARAYTLLDTPIITGTRRTADDLAGIFAGA